MDFEVFKHHTSFLVKEHLLLNGSIKVTDLKFLAVLCYMIEIMVLTDQRHISCDFDDMGVFISLGKKIPTLYSR